MTDLASTPTAARQPRPAGPWWKSAVVYQIYPRSFADSNGDGIGDLRGIIDHLDHLAGLGVDVIWLSPIYASPHDDNGYDISDYQAIDPVFGTLADFDALVADVHRRGMRLVMDLVVNHTSDEHPWFIESATGPDSPRRDWYWWRPARPGQEPGEPGAEPTNWKSFFSGPAWEFDESSGEYYLHLFSRKQPDLNWENPAVRQAIHDMMRWWLDRGVDGFRMDVINMISKDPKLPDGSVANGDEYGDGFPHYGYGPRIHEYLHEMHEVVFADRPDRCLTVAEMPGVTVEQARLFTDPARREVDMVFQFEHMELDHGSGGKWDVVQPSVLALRESFARWQIGLNGVGWNSLYWSNHDQPRIVSRLGDDQKYWAESATALATVLHLQLGTPFIYQGEEIGMTNVTFAAIDDIRDIESINYYNEAVGRHGIAPEEALNRVRTSSRDNARTPMQWDTTRNAGFTTGTPWLAVNPNHMVINAAAQCGVAGSIFEYYRALVDIRHSEPTVSLGDFELVFKDHPAVFAYLRSLGSTQLLVIANLTSSTAVIEDFDMTRWLDAEVLLSNYEPVWRERLDSANSISLRPWEAIVFRVDLDDIDIAI